jgi:aryl-alcohol dehydrogenase-like predicted oxidoreductase
MEYGYLGKTGLYISRLCFGSLTIGPLQADLPVREGSLLIETALDKGVNFIDTAELYGTYTHIGHAIKNRKDKPVLASKSYAYTRRMMKESVQRALWEMDIPSIEIFMLHEQESALTLKGHREALEYLQEAKDEGLITAAGISCHTVAAAKAACSVPGIDVVHPLVNMKGIGIRDGTLADMLAAITELRRADIGIIGMKPLAGGHLIHENYAALRFVIEQPLLDAVAVGMSTVAEVNFNCALFSGETVPPMLAASLRKQHRRLYVHDWCTGCGTCTLYCPQKALSVEGDRAVVDAELCVLCGYCGAYCPEFCLKIF